ncbi:MAG: hypothetical protein M1826_004596 [Phylliscum demangeonii]|nr:MAG: hypothetical protein M1826_004596 [Phylliscum demangeonii]
MENPGRPIKFVSVNDLSDSDEKDMEVDSPQESAEQIGEPNEEHAGPILPIPSVNVDEPPLKKLAFDAGDAMASVPKWSNPDPDLLPALVPAPRPKTDVVKLIRKARVAATTIAASENEVAKNSDFISLLDSDDEVEVVETKKARPDESPGHLPKSRKRKHEDDREPNPKWRAADPQTVDSTIVREWRVVDKALSTPWREVDHSGTLNVGDWLHKELRDFWAYARPRSFEENVRHDLVQKLRAAVSYRYPGWEVHPFGSFAAGIYLPDADMDLVCVTKKFMDGGRADFQANTRPFLGRFADFLIIDGFVRHGSLHVISAAKVPLIKYIDQATGLRVDVSFENLTGLVAVQTYRFWKTDFPAMPIIVAVIKQFLAMRGLHEVRHGGLGGFAVTCLVTSFLQHMPQVQSNFRMAELHLGEILMEFLSFYGKDFDLSTIAIRLDPPERRLPSRWQYEERYRADRADRLMIEDPNRPANDISGGSKRIVPILRLFSEAHDTLCRKSYDLRCADLSERSGQSILGSILAGNYSSFERQRRHLKDVILVDLRLSRAQLSRDDPSLRGPVEEGGGPRNVRVHPALMSTMPFLARPLSDRHLLRWQVDGGGRRRKVTTELCWCRWLLIGRGLQLLLKDAVHLAADVRALLCDEAMKTRVHETLQTAGWQSDGVRPKYRVTWELFWQLRAPLPTDVPGAPPAVLMALHRPFWGLPSGEVMRFLRAE